MLVQTGITVLRTLRQFLNKRILGVASCGQGVSGSLSLIFPQTSNRTAVLLKYNAGLLFFML